ncbi:hypothetical protein ACFL1T_04880, partial [Chlamydiota bacterium]
TISRAVPKIPLSSQKNLITVGTGGSILQLAGLLYAKKSLESDEIHHLKIPLSAITDCVDFLTKKSLAERIQLRALDPARADSIIPGILILQTFMEKKLSAKVLSVVFAIQFVTVFQLC